jgi:hypothetical protein
VWIKTDSFIDHDLEDASLYVYVLEKLYKFSLDDSHK